jgi:hypothetical protein
MLAMFVSFSHSNNMDNKPSSNSLSYQGKLLIFSLISDSALGCSSVSGFETGSGLFLMPHREVQSRLALGTCAVLIW